MHAEKWQKPLVVSVVFAIALYVLSVMAADSDRVFESLAAINPLTWAAVLGLSLGNYVLRYVRWDMYLRSLSGIRVPHKQHLCYYLAGFALSTTPGKAGEAIRAWYLHRHGIRVRHSVGALFVERLLDLFAIAVLSVAGVWVFREYRWFVFLVIGGIVVGMIILQRRHWFRGLASRTSGQGRLARGLKHLSGMLDDCAALLRGRWLASGLLLGILSWGGEGIGFWLVLQAMGQQVDLATAVSVYGIAVLVGALSFLPGGLGGTEAVMTLLLMAVGVDNAVAVAATLVCRAATLWLAVVIGLCVMAGLSLRDGISPVNSNNNTAED